MNEFEQLLTHRIKADGTDTHKAPFSPAHTFAGRRHWVNERNTSDPPVGDDETVAGDGGSEPEPEPEPELEPEVGQEWEGQPARPGSAGAPKGALRGAWLGVGERGPPRASSAGTARRPASARSATARPFSAAAGSSARSAMSSPSADRRPASARPASGERASVVADSLRDTRGVCICVCLAGS